jgi:hypothetical protein
MYKIDKNLHDSIIILKDYVNKYKDEQHLEIELRLGYLENNQFNTNVGHDFFDKIQTTLVNSEVWSKIDHTVTTDYFYNSRRLTVDGKESVCVKKVKLEQFDFNIENSGFDLRVSFSNEFPSKRFAIDRAEYKRIKERTTFRWKDIKFDLTKVTVENNTIKNINYEIEIEPIKYDPKKMTSHYFIHDCLLKIKDIVNICESVDDNCKFVLVGQKKF